MSSNPGGSGVVEHLKKNARRTTFLLGGRSRLAMPPGEFLLWYDMINVAVGLLASVRAWYYMPVTCSLHRNPSSNTISPKIYPLHPSPRFRHVIQVPLLYSSPEQVHTQIRLPKKGRTNPPAYAIWSPFAFIIIAPMFPRLRPPSCGLGASRDRRFLLAHGTVHYAYACVRVWVSAYWARNWMGFANTISIAWYSCLGRRALVSVSECVVAIALTAVARLFSASILILFISWVLDHRMEGSWGLTREKLQPPVL